MLSSIFFILLHSTTWTVGLKKQPLVSYEFNGGGIKGQEPREATFGANFTPELGLELSESLQSRDVTHPSNSSPGRGYGGLKISTLTVEALATCDIPACAVARALRLIRTRCHSPLAHFSRDVSPFLLSSRFFSLSCLSSNCRVSALSSSSPRFLSVPV
jgi:hypothetical protein